MSTTRADSRTEETTVRTDDGAALAVTVLAPLRAPTGTTVVLAHGWAAGRRVWGTVTDRLIRSGHRVVLYDQRGHGASGLGKEPIAIRRFGADLAAVLGETGSRDALLVGHSGGGFAALSYVTADPGAARRLRGLVLLGTAAHDQDTPDSEVRMMGSALFSRALRRPALGRRLLAQTMGKGADPYALEVNRQMFAAASPGYAPTASPRPAAWICARNWPPSTCPPWSSRESTTGSSSRNWATRSPRRCRTRGSNASRAPVICCRWSGRRRSYARCRA